MGRLYAGVERALESAVSPERDLDAKTFHGSPSGSPPLESAVSPERDLDFSVQAGFHAETPLESAVSPERDLDLKIAKTFHGSPSGWNRPLALRGI